MNLDCIDTSKSYVDIVPATPLLHTQASNSNSFWPTPQAEARLGQHFLQQPAHIVRSSTAPIGRGRGSVSISPAEGVLAREFPHPQAHSPHPDIHTTDIQKRHVSSTPSLPPVLPSQQLKSNLSATSSPAFNQDTVPRGLYTPPDSAPLQRLRLSHYQEQNMADPRRAQGGQRPMMGPPETPSRVMQASPNLFPSLQFSPDLFSTHNMGPMTAPIYPQQRLFWDPSGLSAQEQHPQPYANMYQDDINNSFNSNTTVVPVYSPLIPQEQQYELPMQPHSAGPFVDNTVFPAPFHTSPRPLPPSNENPTLFLSSPARRFGGLEAPVPTYTRRPSHEVPAYHHQIEESRREMEAERERRRKASKKADDELIMSSVNRALSPSTSLRPGLKRSNTHSGVAPKDSRFRRQSQVSFNDSASATSRVSNVSSRTGRSSPLKQTSFAASARSKAFQKPRASMSLAIDENGVAKTVLEELPGSDDEMDLDDDSRSLTSSIDENDFHMLRSQPGSFAAFADDNISAQSFSMKRKQDTGRGASVKRVNHLSSASSSSTGTDHRRQQVDTIRQPKRGLMQIDTSDHRGPGDAQKALLAIIQDRSRSTSTQDDYASSRQSDSSLQFHSSPPLQQNQFGAFNASPTTITDPDLATPSTDQDSLGIMRCICNSNSLDGSATLQCDSCSKLLHAKCIGINPRRIPTVYVCNYCEQTPVRHTTNRGSNRATLHGTGPNQNNSPLAHKSSRQQRTR